MQEQPPGRPLTAPRSIFEVGGERFEAASRGFAEAIAAAHAAHRRPRCMCLVEGVEMYVARLAGTDQGFIVKRMPNTGSRHAPDCPSYEPPPELSGLGQVLGSAITEDPATGETTLKLDFPLTKLAGRPAMPGKRDDRASVSGECSRLSLRGLLHYLWDQAELTHWHPGFAGKRSWGTVRRHLLQAAENKIAHGDALRTRLYIPEVFSVEQRAAINARRVAQWLHALSAPGRPQHLMLMIAEVKEVVPARYGHTAIVKHVPDQAFALDAQLYRRMDRRFETELRLWGATDELHMVMIATFSVSEFGIPAIVELSLMPVTRQWLPVEDALDKHLLDQLVGEGRSFVKGLRYNLPSRQLMANATLTDTADTPMALYIARHDGGEGHPDIPGEQQPGTEACSAWVWRVFEGAMPQLPPNARSAVAA